MAFLRGLPAWPSCMTFLRGHPAIALTSGCCISTCKMETLMAYPVIYNVFGICVVAQHPDSRWRALLQTWVSTTCWHALQACMRQVHYSGNVCPACIVLACTPCSGGRRRDTSLPDQPRAWLTRTPTSPHNASRSHSALTQLSLSPHSALTDQHISSCTRFSAVAAVLLMGR